MAITYVEIEDRYYVQPSDTEPVSVNVIIGDGQTGGYLIFLDKKFITANKAGNLKAANKLAGKRCLVSVTVVDQRDETNWTSITVEVKKGDQSKVFGPYSKEASAHLDTICYSFSLHFTQP